MIYTPENLLYMTSIRAHFQLLDDYLKEAKVAAIAGDKERYERVMKRFDEVKARGPVGFEKKGPSECVPDVTT